MLKWTLFLVVTVATFLTRGDAHETGNDPHIQSEFDEDKGTFTYILKVPDRKKESKCECHDQLQVLQDQLDILTLRFEKVLGKLSSVTLGESLGRVAEELQVELGFKPDVNGSKTITDELSQSQRVAVNSTEDGVTEKPSRPTESTPEKEDLTSENGTVVPVQGPGELTTVHLRVIRPNNEMNVTKKPVNPGQGRGDAPVISQHSKGKEAHKNKGKAKSPEITTNENDIKPGHTEGSADDVGLTVELSPDIIRPAITLEESMINLIKEEEKKTALVLAKQNINDPCTGGCACFNMTTESGIYSIKRPEKLSKKSTHMKVYCDMSTDHGGWTVIQRRFDGTENFFRSWSHYARGFGNKNSEFWIGNNFIHAMTSSGKYELRIEFEDWEGQQGFAHYDGFHIMDEDHMYRLILGKFVGGNRGDSMSYHNNTLFSTKDRDNDWFFGNCAVLRKSGFWFKECNHANPNGLWIGQGDGSGRNGAIITWGSWGTYGYKYCMKSFKMMIRPEHYR
ncbi:fibrinogen gamma chain-like [Anneissia japonica]|uniref:fibrinogen gamma chain-like n=1 Tax=Anneissia japonica TaxID=1529436 RepID=UPI0014257ED4|nr:fibrinogen gamma chain-like [Anneissia japonica]